MGLYRGDAAAQVRDRADRRLWPPASSNCCNMRPPRCSSAGPRCADVERAPIRASLSGRANSSRSRSAVLLRMSRWPMRCGSGHAASTRAAGWQRASIWKGGKWVRVTDDLNETRGGSGSIARCGFAGQAGWTCQSSTAPWSCSRCSRHHWPGDPRLQQVIGIENDISDLDCGHHDRGGHRHPEPASRGVPEPRAVGQRAAGADTGRCADCGVRAARART